MPNQNGAAVTGRQLRDRLGGRWAISLPPYLWSTPFVVILTPFATVSPAVDQVLFLNLVVFSIFGWLAFGGLLALGHFTYFRNRDSAPVSPIATLALGGIAGLGRSLASGDWFSIAGHFGLHSPALVIEAVISGVAWIVLTAGFMESKYSFTTERDLLITKQSQLLKSSEQWLIDVRSQRFALANSIRDQIRDDWQATREALLMQLNNSPLNWQKVVDDLVLSSEETVQSLSASLATESQQATRIRDGFSLIARTPILETRNTAAFIALIGFVPMANITDVFTSTAVMLFAFVVFSIIRRLGLLATKHFPQHSSLTYWIVTLAIGFSAFLVTPILTSAGISNEVAIAYIILGFAILSFSFTGLNFIKLNKLVRDQQLSNLQTQNVLLESLEQARNQQAFEARLDLVSYLSATIRNSVMTAKNTIENGIHAGDIAAVNSGLAVIDAVYSSILSKYTSEDEIDLRLEIEELAKPWTRNSIITWRIEGVDLPSETRRRILLICGECISELMVNELALRIHIEVKGEGSKASLVLESNADKSWPENAQLTRNVLDASTTNWTINGNQSQSRLEATFG